MPTGLWAAAPATNRIPTDPAVARQIKLVPWYDPYLAVRLRNNKTGPEQQSRQIQESHGGRCG